MPKRERSAMERAHERISERILALELRPGAVLDDLRTASDLGLSRTPVREALYRLAAEGLVEAGPRGFQVAGLDLVRIRSLFEAHQVLARSVARLLVARATDADLDRLEELTRTVEAAVGRGDAQEIAHANAALHTLETSLAGNEYLEALAIRIHRENHRLAVISLGGDASLGDAPAHHRLVCAEHAEILAALRARDADLAERLAAEHVDSFRRRIARLLEDPPTALTTLSGIGADPGS